MNKTSPKTPGSKVLSLPHRILWVDNMLSDKALEIVDEIHDDNPRSRTYCDRTDVAAYESNKESDIEDKKRDEGLKPKPIDAALIKPGLKL